MKSQSQFRTPRSSSPRHQIRSSSPRATSPRTRRVEKLHGLKEKVQKALAEQKQSPKSSFVVLPDNQFPMQSLKDDNNSPNETNFLVQSVKSKFESANSGKPQAFAQMDVVTKENRGSVSPRVINATVFGEKDHTKSTAKSSPSLFQKKSFNESSSSISSLSSSSPGTSPLNNSSPVKNTIPTTNQNEELITQRVITGVDKAEMASRRAAFESPGQNNTGSDIGNHRLSKWTMLTSAFEQGKLKNNHSNLANSKPVVPIHEKSQNTSMTVSNKQKQKKLQPPSSVQDAPLSPPRGKKGNSMNNKGFPRPASENMIDENKSKKSNQKKKTTTPSSSSNEKFVTPVSKKSSSASKASSTSSKLKQSNIDQPNATAAWYSAPPPPPPPPPPQEEEILLLSPPSGPTSHFGIDLRSPTRNDFIAHQLRLDDEVDNDDDVNQLKNRNLVREKIEQHNKNNNQLQPSMLTRSFSDRHDKIHDGRMMSEPVKSDEEKVGGVGGGASAADVAAVSVAVVAEYNRRLELSDTNLREAELISADLAIRLEDALAREDELVRRLQKHPVTPTRPSNSTPPSSPEKTQYAELLEGYKAAATAAREDAEAARRDAENTRLDARRREELIRIQAESSALEKENLKQQNAQLEAEVIMLRQQNLQLQHENKTPATFSTELQQQQQQQEEAFLIELSKANEKINNLEHQCEQLKGNLQDEHKNHQDMLYSTHEKLNRLNEEKASVDSRARSFEVRLNEMTRQCEILANEKDSALSSVQKHSPAKMEAEVRNAVSNARRDAQAQHGLVTSELEKLRREAEQEAAHAHDLLSQETAALKATRKELDELLSESAKGSRHTAELMARIKRLEEDMEFADNRADRAEERFRELQASVRGGGQRDSSIGFSESEIPKRESRWGSAINSIYGGGGGGLSRSKSVSEKRIDNSWIVRSSSSPQRRSSLSNANPIVKTPEHLWVNKLESTASQSFHDDGENNIQDTIAEGDGNNPSKLSRFLAGSPIERSNSSPRPITPEKQKPSIPERKTSMTLADFMKIMPAEKARAK